MGLVAGGLSNKEIDAFRKMRVKNRITLVALGIALQHWQN
jgi:hypothetical protein